MLSAPDCSEAGRLSGRKTVRVSEKSNFTQTCSLLSQYLKNKGSFGDLSLGMTCNLEGKGKPETFHQVGTTMNLLPNLEILVEGSNVSERNAATFRNVNSMDLFPQNSGFGPSISTEDPKKTDFSGPATKAQMTIFYAGKVIVLDDFPADKAKEIMLLAQNSSNIASISGKDQLTSSSLVAPSSNIVTNSGNNSNQERSQKPPVPIVSDMPIARKASLHRFLEKRKDRISAKAPYQGSNTAATSSKPAESKAWLGLASVFKEE